MCNVNAEVIGEVQEAPQEQPVQEQLGSSIFFPTTFYTIKKENFLENARAVFNEHVAPMKKEKKKNGDKLGNQLYPVVMTGNLFNDPRIQNLCQYIGQTAWNILKSQGFKMDDKVTTFTEFWGQEHHKHSAMDEHIHPYGAQIVGFYFIDVPSDSSRVVIHDPRPGKVMAHMLEENMANVTEASNQVNFQPEPGLMMFANAWLPHSFTRHGSLKPLKFIHFNIGVQMAQSSPGSTPSSAEII